MTRVKATTTAKKTRVPRMASAGKTSLVATDPGARTATTARQAVEATLLARRS
jgi:hypothetical protein